MLRASRAVNSSNRSPFEGRVEPELSFINAIQRPDARSRQPAPALQRSLSKNLDGVLTASMKEAGQNSGAFLIGGSS